MLLDLIGYARCITASEFLDELSSLLSSKSQGPDCANPDTIRSVSPSASVSAYLGGIITN